MAAGYARPHSASPYYYPPGRPRPAGVEAQGAARGAQWQGQGQAGAQASTRGFSTSRPGSASIQREAATSRPGSGSFQRGGAASRPVSAAIRPGDAFVQQEAVPLTPVGSRPGSAFIQRKTVPLSPASPGTDGWHEGSSGGPRPGSPFRNVSPSLLRSAESPRQLRSGSPSLLRSSAESPRQFRSGSPSQDSPLQRDVLPRQGSPLRGNSRPCSALSERKGSSRQGSPRRSIPLMSPTPLALARQPSAQPPGLCLSPHPRLPRESSLTGLPTSPRRAPPLMDRRASSSSAADLAFTSPVIIEPLSPRGWGGRLPTADPADGDDDAGVTPRAAGRGSSPDRLLLARSPSTIPADMLQTMLGVYEGLFRTA